MILCPFNTDVNNHIFHAKNLVPIAHLFEITLIFEVLVHVIFAIAVPLNIHVVMILLPSYNINNRDDIFEFFYSYNLFLAKTIINEDKR